MDDSWKQKGAIGAYCVNPFGGVDSTHCYTKTGLFYKKTGWHYLTYVVDPANGTQSFYIDGTLRASTDSAIAIVYTNVGTDTYLGKHGNARTDFNFTGLIDEVRISRIAYSAAWIKLCYESQKLNSTVVIVK
jgi:hypothetical protein